MGQDHVHAETAYLMADRKKADRKEGTGHLGYPSKQPVSSN